MRPGILFSLVFATSLSLALGACSRSPDERPNLLLITLDTTRPDHLGLYGYEKPTSPNLDRLAEESVVYDHAYATSSWTLASHASLFTGLWPQQHGAQSVPEGQNRELGYGVRSLDDSFTTLAETLRGRGYRTAAVIAGPALRSELGVAQGFEIFDDEFSSQLALFNGRRAEPVIDRALELIESFGNQPWFLFINVFDPHAPYRPPPPHDGGLPQAGEAAGLGARVKKGIVARAAREEAWRPVADLDSETAEFFGRQLAGYDAEIRYMDLHLGRLFESVRADDAGRGTVLAITADHGESFGEHFLFSHGAHLYEDNVRVPLLIRYPRGRGAGRVGTPVQNHRLFDALVAAAGGNATPTAFDDSPQPIVLEVRQSDANTRILGEFFARNLRAIVAPPYKLIESSSGKKELFRLDTDPGELADLSESEAATVERLSEQLAEIAAEYPPLYREESRAGLRDETAESLRALGYLD